MSTNSFSFPSYIFTSSNNKGWGYVERLVKLALSNLKRVNGAVDSDWKTLGIEIVFPTPSQNSVDNPQVIPGSPHNFPQSSTGATNVIHNLSTSYPHVRKIIGINLEAL